MPYKVTIEVVLPRRGDRNWDRVKVNGFRLASVVAVYYPPKFVLGGDVRMVNTGYLHVRGIPDTLKVDKLRAILQKEDETGEFQTAWHMTTEQMTQPDAKKLLDDLLKDRQAEIAWSDFKSYFGHMRAGDRRPQDADFE